MSYALGQAKWVPGQIHFQTTRTGRLPSLQPLIEAGLPIAPYIEHGSYTTGQPAIMRYGLDPYRGISGAPGCPPDATAYDETGWYTKTPIVPLGQPERVGEAVQETITETIRATLSPTVMVGTGIAVGAGAGVAGGLTRSAVLGGLIGAVGGGILGYLGWKSWLAPARPMAPKLPAESAPAAPGLSGILAVL